MVKPNHEADRKTVVTGIGDSPCLVCCVCACLASVPGEGLRVSPRMADKSRWPPLVGTSIGDPIIGRLSVGPFATTVNLRAIVDVPNSGATHSITKLHEFDMIELLDDDQLNDSRQNELWATISTVVFGRVARGTRTCGKF